MKLAEISRELFEAELEELKLNEAMYGSIGSGKMEALTLCRESKAIGTEVLKQFISQALRGDKLAKRAGEVDGPSGMAQMLLSEPEYIDLPVKLFMLGLRLGQKQSVEEPDAISK